MDDVGIGNPVGILGATSFVGACLLRLLAQLNYRVTAFTRHPVKRTNDNVVWRQLPAPFSTEILTEYGGNVPLWICVAPIWALPEYFILLEKNGAQRIVVLSSTSRFSKSNSSDPEEQALANRFAESERVLQEWAESRGIEWVVIRPTLIYGFGQDKNITEIVRFIHRFHFFPLLGRAKGLRQPIHAEDVAAACITALQTPCAANRAYNISGGETLPYRDMVLRIFSAAGLRPRLITVPLWAFRLAVAALRCLPRYRYWSSAMAERMNMDLAFDHLAASRDLDFKPRKFILGQADIRL